MPKLPKIDFKRFLKRKSAEEVEPPTTHKTGSRLSVNSLSKVSNQLSSLGKGETIRKLSFWICFILCANFAGDLFSLLFEKYLPTPPVSILSSRGKASNQLSSSVQYEIIADRNLFSSKAPKKASDGIDLESEPVLSTLPLQLIGTVIFHNPARSLAAIQDKTESKMYPVRMGDQINDNVQILSVEPRRVVFINSSARRKEFIEIPEDQVKISTTTYAPKPSGGIQKEDETKFSISRSEIDSQMANFNVLITQARAVPEMRGGQMIGFKLTQIVPGSFYQKAGFNENDVIKSVNGEKITDAAKALELLQGIKSMPSLDMVIERNGKDINRNYDIR